MKREPQSHTLLKKHLAELRIPFDTEVPFCDRKWRLDFLLTGRGVGIEIMGSTWSAGRHTRGKGYQSDCDKANMATILGIRLLRFTTEDVLQGRARAFLSEWLTPIERAAKRISMAGNGIEMHP